MSDADNQMGGHGGWTGPDPAEQTDAPPDPTKGNAGGADTEKDEEEKLDEEGQESFPASDPPGHG